MSGSNHSRAPSRTIKKAVSVEKEVKSHVDDALKNDGSSQHLTEVDREWYNIRISDLEGKLKRSVGGLFNIKNWTSRIFCRVVNQGTRMNASSIKRKRQPPRKCWTNQAAISKTSFHFYSKAFNCETTSASSSKKDSKVYNL